MGETEQAILDAARAAVLAHGIRRTTAADIARRSGVSRQTIYRYWPDITSLYAALLTRELLTTVPEGAPAPGVPLSQLVDQLVAVAARVRDLPLLARLRETDPELFSRYVLERLGTSQRAILDRLAAVLTAGQASGAVRSGDPARLAAMVLLIVQSAVQSAPLVADWLAGDAWSQELAHALRGYLAPARSARGQR